MNDWAAKAARQVCEVLEGGGFLIGRKVEDHIAAIVAAHAGPLVSLLLASRRGHRKDPINEMDSCPLLRDKKMNDHLCIKHVCNCGADEWNERVYKVIGPT